MFHCIAVRAPDMADYDDLGRLLLARGELWRRLQERATALQCDASLRRTECEHVTLKGSDCEDEVEHEDEEPPSVVEVLSARARGLLGVCGEVGDGCSDDDAGAECPDPDVVACELEGAWSHRGAWVSAECGLALRF